MKGPRQKTTYQETQFFEFCQLLFWALSMAIWRELLCDQSLSSAALEPEQAQYLRKKDLLLSFDFSNSHETAPWLEQQGYNALVLH